MSIVLRRSCGYLVDHEQAINLTCGSLPFESRRSIFGIFQPYNARKIRTSVFTTNCESNNSSTKLETSSCGTESDKSKKKKKRKRKQSLNIGEVNALEYHEKIREKIETGLDVLTKFSQWTDYFQPSNSQGPEDTSNFLRAASDCNELLSVINNKKFKEHSSTLHAVEDVSYQVSDVVNRTVYNEKKTSMLISVSAAKYILPARSKFFLSDIIHLRSFAKASGCHKYDLIVIDPPWENKSVKRGAKYSSLPLWEIKKLPISDLAANLALVIVWVTNKQKYRKFVLEELFPNWSCKHVGEWHWVKVTRNGEMVYDLDSTHKKPYEPLLIGRFDERIKPCERRTIDKTGPEEFNNRTDEMTIYPGLEGKNQGKVKVSLENVRETKDKGQQSDFERILPQHQIICSVPCSFHSRKPPLNDIFNEYLPDNAKCIELFARSLLADWTSWGNEALKFQHLDYFRRRNR